MDFTGAPLWYELTTPDLDAAGRYYSDVIGWTVADSGMPGVGDYRIASSGSGMVAGMMAPPMPGIPPNWMIYFGAPDLDAMLAAMTADGATVVAGPMPVPGVGRIAVVADPQGAHFGLLEPPAGMTPPPGAAPFDQKAWGHGCWHELMSSDPAAGLAFYVKHFGWTPSTPMDMGDMGTYQLVAREGQDIGGIMAKGPAPVSHWMPVFGVEGIDAAAARITAGGGQVMFGPAEVPGGVFSVSFRDPQGAYCSLVGPK